MIFFSGARNARLARRILRPLVAGIVLIGAISFYFNIQAKAPAPLTNARSLQPDIDRKYQKTCLSSGCHATSATARAILHPPFLEGRCLACHNDHATSQPAKGLLKEPINKQCLTCHTGMELTSQPLAAAHPPGGKSCTDCHNPHESRVRNLLRSDANLLECAQCHADFLAKMAQMPYRHHYLDPKSQCGQCHYAHRRPGQKYLRENVGESCLTCHDLPINVGGRVLENVVERMNQAKYVHAAMLRGACPSCHTPHGSPQPSLLKSGYPPGSYEKYDANNYGLCWQCHSKALAEDAKGEGVTRFRNGDENLHWRHVTFLKRGRACHLCHAAHSSDTPHLMRPVVQFNQWPAPLVYKPTQDGGSCQTPCHKEYEYKRRPSALDAPKPSPAAAETPAPAGGKK